MYKFSKQFHYYKTPSQNQARIGRTTEHCTSRHYIIKLQLLNYRTYLLFSLKLAGLTLKTESLAGSGLVLRLTISRPMVITLQLATEDNLPINRETGGLADTRTDPPRQHQPGTLKETDPKELLLPHSSPFKAIPSRF